MIAFQVIANKETRACITEWFPENETIAIIYNMDEHLTNELNLSENQSKETQKQILTNLSNNIKVSVYAGNNQMIFESKGDLAGTITLVTDSYQNLSICVHNNLNYQVLMGKL